MTMSPRSLATSSEQRDTPPPLFYDNEQPPEDYYHTAVAPVVKETGATEGITPRDRERYILSRCLADVDFAETVSTKILADDWLELGHKEIFQCVGLAWEMVHGTRNLDARAIMIQAGLLDVTRVVSGIGGELYINEILKLRVSPQEASVLLDQLLQHNDNLRLMDAGAQIYDLGAAGKPGAIAKAEGVIIQIADRRTPSTMVPISKLTATAMAEIDGDAKKADIFIASGLKGIDGPLMGVGPRRQIVIGMGTHNGKTALSLNYALRAAMRQDVVVNYFSREELPDEMTNKFLAMMTGPHIPWVLRDKQEPINRVCIRPNRIMLIRQDEETVRKKVIEMLRESGEYIFADPVTREERAELANAATHLNRMKINFDEGMMDMDGVRSVNRMMARQNPNSFVICIYDYMQMTDSDYQADGTMSRTKTDEITYISRSLKQSALQDMRGRGSTIGNVQITKEGDKAVASAAPGTPARQYLDKRFISGAGAIAHDADAIFMASRDDMHPDYKGDASTWGVFNGAWFKNRISGFMPGVRLHLNKVNLAVVNQQYKVYEMGAADEEEPRH